MQIERRDDLVRPVGAVTSDDVRRRGDAGRVDLLDLIGVGEDVAELPCKELHFRRIELEVGEGDNCFDLGTAELSGHGKMLAHDI